MNTKVILLAIATASLLSSCVQPSSSPGQYSAGINEGRSNSRALTSGARLNQNRIQRANEIEEARHESELRAHDRDRALSPLRTASEMFSMVRSTGILCRR